jgi:hypothetical protein
MTGGKVRFAPILVIAVVACGISDLGPGNSSLPVGTYTITRTFANPATPPGVFKISVVSATTTQVIFDWTAGDVAGTLPVRDTANASGDAYAVAWHGNAITNQSLRFTVTTCSGIDVDAVTGSLAWPGCNIAGIVIIQ